MHEILEGVAEALRDQISPLWCVEAREACIDISRKHQSGTVIRCRYPVEGTEIHAGRRVLDLNDPTSLDEFTALVQNHLWAQETDHSFLDHQPQADNATTTLPTTMESITTYGTPMMTKQAITKIVWPPE